MTSTAAVDGEGNIPDEMRQRGLRYCHEFLGGAWSTISIDDFHMHEISVEGSSDELYHCRLADNVSPTHEDDEDDEPRSALLRLYGSAFRNSGSKALTDTISVALLAEKGIGPKLFGVFEDGRLEEYVPWRCLTTDELRDADVSEACARILAQFHGQQMPTDKEPVWLEDMLTRYTNGALDLIKSYSDSGDDNNIRLEKLNKIRSFDLQEELKSLMHLLKKVQSPVVYCHNDFRAGNILHEAAPGGWTLRPINFEHAAYNYRGYDIALHLCEWCYNFDHSEPPYFIARHRDYPNREQQLRFVRAYLEAGKNNGGGVTTEGMESQYCRERSDGAGDVDLEDILVEVDAFTLASHFLSGVRNVVQSFSANNECSYLDNALARFDAYFENKKRVDQRIVSDIAKAKTSTEERRATLDETEDVNKRSTSSAVMSTAAADGESPEDTRRRGLTYCQRFLGGAWLSASNDDVDVHEMKGGLSNKLYSYRLSDDVPSIGDEPRCVLLRIFGRYVLDSQQNLLNDSLIFAILAERKVGPKLYGVFAEGRLEEYIPSRHVFTRELHDPDVSRACARLIARFHKVRGMPTVKQPTWLRDNMMRYKNEVLQKILSDRGENRPEILQKIESFKLAEEFDWLLNVFDKVHSPVVFSHNDTQEGNILYVETPHGWHVRPIDFEATNYNYRGFDLANHLCEWCFNYEHPEPPHYVARLQDYPSREQQLTFVRAYLEETNDDGHKPQTGSDPTAAEEQLLREVSVFTLASHFFIGSWAITESYTSDLIDFMAYAFERFDAYFKHKPLVEQILSALTEDVVVAEDGGQ